MLYETPIAVDQLFPGAADYRRLFFENEVCERAGHYFPYTERHLQALWFDDSLRAKELKTLCGEPVVVKSPGRWNLEAGPDFLGAVLLVGDEQRRIAGDAEIHIVSADWKNHGHPTDPRYENVRFHITWFSEPIDKSLFPPGTLHISLSDISTTDLESIDVTAYPYQEPRASKPFLMPGRGQSFHLSVFPTIGNGPDEILQWLENAGQERLRQKTQRLAWLMKERGEAQVLYEETAVALGYKRNKAPFRKLTQILPLSALAQYGSDWETIYAVLLGISGLLPRQPGTKWSAESKAYFRSLWDCWWREEHKWEEAVPCVREDWDFSGLRPLNHPVRRLCALAQYIAFGLFSGEALGTRSVAMQRRCFWSTHVGWTGTENKAELIGKGRLQAMDLNVFVPYRLAKGDSFALDNLPVEPMNSVIKETAYALFGPDHSPKLYRTALARQGLIQIFTDFILTGNPMNF